MNVSEIIALAELAAKLVGVVTQNVERAKDAMKPSELGRLQKILEPLHAENGKLAASVDEALRKA